MGIVGSLPGCGGSFRADIGPSTTAGLMIEAERSAYRKNDGSSRYANRTRARSTRLAGSVRDCAIDLNLSTSASPSDNSIARRCHSLQSFVLNAPAYIGA